MFRPTTPVTLAWPGQADRLEAVPKPSLMPVGSQTPCEQEIRKSYVKGDQPMSEASLLTLGLAFFMPLGYALIAVGGLP